MATVPGTQKILTSSPDVNTTYGGSPALKELNTWVTIDDIVETVQPYRSLIIGNIAYNVNSVSSYTILANSFDSNVEVTADSSYTLVVKIVNLEGASVSAAKVFVTGNSTFFPQAVFGSVLEESGFIGASSTGYVLFRTHEMPTSTIVGNDLCQLEIRIYN